MNVLLSSNSVRMNVNILLKYTALLAINIRQMGGNICGYMTKKAIFLKQALNHYQR